MSQRTLISILNWNGWEDTIACCNSIVPALDDCTDVLILDNGSGNDSVARLRAYLSAQSSNAAHGLDEMGVLTDRFSVGNSCIALLHLPENLGFAKGCNRAAAYAHEHGYQFLVLLNNDTVIASDALSLMHQTLLRESADVVIPRIEYFDPAGEIWNCGGEVNYWGRVKYHFARKASRGLELPPVFQIGFATGCCMLMRVNFFAQVGGFTERFFFGEEDVEFGLRMKALGRKMLCDTRALVLHKVGASLKGNPERDLRKAYVHLLNRLVNMKAFMPRVVWGVWAGAVCVRFRVAKTYKFKRTFAQSFRLFREACVSSGVSGDRFRTILRDGV